MEQRRRHRDMRVTLRLWVGATAFATLLAGGFWGGGGSGVGAPTAVMINLTAADDDYEFWVAPQTVTLGAATCYCRGTCAPTIATITFQDRAGNAIALASGLTCGSGAADSTYVNFDTADGDRVLVTGEGLRFNVTNTPDPATDEYTISVRLQ